MPGADQLSALVLAAGFSRRARPDHKLLLDFAGRSVVRATVEAVAAAGCGEVLVITGHARDRIEAALAGLPVRCCFAPDFAGGMGHSLAAGIRACRPAAAGFLVVPADLPELSAARVRSVADAFAHLDGRWHIVPTCAGARGHPVVLGAWLRPALAQLTGEVGARRALAQPPEAARVHFLETGDPAILRDVDTGLRPPA